MNDSPDPVKGTEKINIDLFLENEKQKERIKQLENRNAKLSKSSNVLPNNSNLKKELETVKNKNKELMSDLEKSKKEIERAKQTEAELIDKIKTLESELEQQSSEPISQTEPSTLDVDEKTMYEEELAKARKIIDRQEQMIEETEDEMVELDRKYDTEIIRLKKVIKSLNNDIKKLETKNERLSVAKFDHLGSGVAPHKVSESESDEALINKMKDILRSWPGGIKLRNLAMSMGISVAITKEFIDVLEKENFVSVDTENMTNSNPVIHPVKV